jgi:hypothetical protein
MLLSGTILNLLIAFIHCAPVEKELLGHRPDSDDLRLLSVSETVSLWADPVELSEQGVQFLDVTDFDDVPGRAEMTRANHADLRTFM